MSFRRITAVAILCSVAGWAGLSAQRAGFSASRESVVVGRGSGQVTFADLDRNGQADMLTRHLLTQTVAIAMGKGGARFAPARTMTLDYPPGDMRVADLNSDGRLDIVVTGNTRDFADVYRGDGRGGFTRFAGSPFTIENTVDALNKRTLHLLDLNEDGHLDIATANGRRRNTLGVLFGNGAGSFTRGPIVSLETGQDRYWYAFGDIDGDGHTDVVTVSNASDAPGARGRLLAQAGDGRGHFRPVAGHPVPLTSAAGALTLADADRDGRLDVAVAHPDGTVSILLNAGGGVFRPMQGSPVRIGPRAYALTMRDIGGDSRPDLVAATADSVTVLLASPSGFTPAAGSPFHAGPGAYSLTINDVNDDGRPDIAASSFEGDFITLLLGR